MKIKIKFDGWNFQDLYDKSFWKKLRLEDYVQSYDILWDSLGEYGRNTLFFEDKELFFVWLDTLSEQGLELITNKILAHKQDVYEEISEDIIYIGLAEGAKKLSNPWAQKELHDLYLLFEQIDALVITTVNGVTVGGNDIEKVKRAVMGYVMNGYQIEENFSYKSVSSGLKIEIYSLKVTGFMPTLGNN